MVISNGFSYQKLVEVRSLVFPIFSLVQTCIPPSVELINYVPISELLTQGLGSGEDTVLLSESVKETLRRNGQNEEDVLDQYNANRCGDLGCEPFFPSDRPRRIRGTSLDRFALT